MKNAIDGLLMLIGFLAFAPGTASAQTRVLKCVAADGSVSFSSAQACPDDAQGKEQVIPAHRVTMTKDEVKRQRALERPPQQMSAEDRAKAYGGSAAEGSTTPARQSPQLASQQVSYRCSVALSTWYQDSPCPPALKQFLNDVEQGPSLPVQQQVVPRSEACLDRNRRQSSSPAGRTRDGNPNADMRASPYEKLIGMDECR